MSLTYPFRFEFERTKMKALVKVVVFSIACLILHQTFAQGPFPKVTDEVVVQDPGFGCYRTANTSCSQHVSLPANTPKCESRVCGWKVVLTPVYGPPPENTLIRYEIEYVPDCQTPIGEPPFEEKVLPDEVPNVQQVTAGQGREQAKQAEVSVQCIGRFLCECTEELSQQQSWCTIASEPYDKHHPVKGLVVDPASPVCEKVPPPPPGGGGQTGNNG